MKKDIIVIGHKNPDTDSICSAISYAYLKNKISDESYVPMRAGEVNPETNYVLNYFSAEAPMLVEDVRAQVKDTVYKEGMAVDKNVSLKKAWDILHDIKMATLVVVDDAGKIEGVVSIGDIAKFFMETMEGCLLTDAKTSYKNVLETIEGEMLVGDKEATLDTGNVVIATANASYLRENLQPNDIVITEDKIEAQKTAIEAGAQCLIICSGDVDETVINLAKENNCTVIKGENDSYVTARLLNQSIPVRYLMKTEGIIMFSEDEYIDDVRDIVADTRHREFPIIDKNGVLKGVIGRDNLIDIDKKQIALVDHNERNQAVNGIADAEIVEIVDHHKIGHIQTLAPVFYRNMPVGCTSTIIYMMYREYGVEIPKQIAGLMCSAILSDTMIFRSPTCTPLDVEAGNALAEIAGIEPEKYGLDMFSSGSDFGSKTDKEIFHLDYKKFNAGDITFGVGQVSSVSKKDLDDLKDRMITYMDSLVATGEVEMVFLMMTDILAESSDLLCVGPRAIEIAEKAFGVTPTDAHSIYLKGAVSRKKQIVPQLTAALQ